MRVSQDYYTKGFDRPEVVKRIVKWCSKQEYAARKAGNRSEELIAKRIKSLCLKNYKLVKEQTARFCAEWEEHPEDMFTWIITQFPTGKCKIVRNDRTTHFSPDNITLRPLS